MRRSLMALAISAGVCALFASSASAGPSDQIVFSKTGAFSPSLGPFGFWIWCTPAGSKYGGANGECAGSMYFYAFPALPSGGSATEQVVGTTTELGSGAYQMTVWSTASGPFAFPIACTLTGPVSPTNGPTNSVSVSCSAPVFGSATATGAVVKVVEP
jgi:hypothetical protein